MYECFMFLHAKWVSEVLNLNVQHSLMSSMVPRGVEIYMQSNTIYWLHHLVGALGHKMLNYTQGRKWQGMSIN